MNYSLMTFVFNEQPNINNLTRIYLQFFCQVTLLYKKDMLLC